MDDLKAVKSALEEKAAMVKIVSPHGGTITCDSNKEHKVDAAIDTTESVLFDAVYIPGGQASVDKLLKHPKFIKFINEALKHCKAIATDNEGEQLLDKTYAADYKDDEAVFINSDVADFAKAIAQHRNWKRMDKVASIPV